jgi:serine/threonine protein kinase/DNA-binding CsgD family transcriptional regulator
MIGRTLRNRYHILDLIGEGSTATVYRARDNRLGRIVALKVLLSHVRDSVQQRFFQEARSAAQLHHPNIMELYDIDEDDGVHFLVVEYVEGDSLANYVPAPAEDTVRLGYQIAMALHYAHERDIIHRDIKPANIKVTPEGQAKIMDLGLALPREAKRVTAAGMIIGTPAYLSPEQAQAQPLDRRTDVYSLGVVLYEMATGQLPFSQDDIPALLLQHVRQPPQPPRNLVADLPIGLENVILKALEKQPSKRYQTCEAVAQALIGVYGSIPGSVGSATGSSPTDTPERATQPAAPAAPVKAPQRTLRLMLADDHGVLRRSLSSVLNERPEFIVVGEAADGEAALRQVNEVKPDVLLLDLNMPVKSGLDVLPEIRAKFPDVKVLILTGRDEDFYITQALRLGAHGYMLKSADERDLVDGILKVSQGTLVLGTGVAEKVVTGMLRGNGERLSDGERLVMLYIAGGYDNDAIAQRLNMDIMEITEILAQAINKLGARDRHGAALAAIRRGYILLDELQALG